MAIFTLKSDKFSVPGACAYTLESNYWRLNTNVTRCSYKVRTDRWLGVDQFTTLFTVRSDKFGVTYNLPKEALGDLYQLVPGIKEGNYYRLTFDATGMEEIYSPATITVTQGTQVIYTFLTTSPGTKTVYFTADGSGTKLCFSPDKYVLQITIDNVSLKKRLQPTLDDDRPVKEFLNGDTDDGRPVIFRADTHPIQMQEDFELISQPMQIVTKSQRGTAVKCYIAIDDQDFYELKGNIIKGVSILNVHTDNLTGIGPEMVNAREIRLSWRDSSKQRCRLIHGALVYNPTNQYFIE